MSDYIGFKKAEFARNFILNTDATPSVEFFKYVVETHVPHFPSGKAGALALCEKPFLADGLDKFGCSRASDRKGAGTSDSQGTAGKEEEWTVERGPFASAEHSTDEILQQVWISTSSRATLRLEIARRLQHLLDHSAEEFGDDGQGFKDDPYRQRLEEVRNILKLSPLEFNIVLCAYVLFQGDCRWEELPDCEMGSRIADRRTILNLIRSFLDADLEDLVKATNENSRLIKLGILSGVNFALYSEVARFIAGEGDGGETLSFHKPLKTDLLPWSYFPKDVQRHGEAIVELVKANLGKRRLNILIHGEPGTGKTAFSCAIADRLSLQPVAVKINERNYFSFGEGKASTPMEIADFRLTQLLIADANCDAEKDMVILDEADNILEFAGANRLNSALDSSKCVHIWICNLDPLRLPDSNLRRFDYAVAFKPLGNRERIQIWRNTAKRFSLGEVLTDETIQDFSKRFAISAGGISLVGQHLSAAIAAGNCKDPIAFAKRLLESHSELLGVKYAKEEAKGQGRVSRGYVLEGLNIAGGYSPTDILAAAKEHLRRTAENEREKEKGKDDETALTTPHLTLLLSGPPGSGKTEFVHWLGEQLRRKVVVLGASDLKDKFVGETEKRMAWVFRRAERDGAVLFFDEVDTFLRSRDMAMQEWEVSQTNELLTQLENFNGLFVAATNNPLSLDPAVARRFTFKLEFDYLDNRGKRLFYKRFFGEEPTEEVARELDSIGKLCPGDFRTVWQRLEYLPGGKDNARRIAALREESELKEALPGMERMRLARPTAIGFAGGD